MKFIKKAIKNLLNWAHREDYSQNALSSNGYSGNLIKASSSVSDNVPVTFTFSVTNATGGKVVTFRHYDQRTDRNTESVYIITDKEDLGEELAQIITKESLTR